MVRAALLLAVATLLVTDAAAAGGQDLSGGHWAVADDRVADVVSLPSARFLLQSATSAAPVADNSSFYVPAPPAEDVILAEERTQRANPLNHLDTYTHGWDVTNVDYWGSLVWTGVPSIILGVVWFASGILMVLGLAFFCCCCSKRMKRKEGKQYTRWALWIPIIIISVFSLLAICGVIVMWVGVARFNQTLLNILQYLEDVGIQVQNLIIFIISVLNQVAASPSLAGRATLSSATRTRITDVTVQLNETAASVVSAIDSAHNDGRKVLRAIDISVMVVGGALILVSLLGLSLLVVRWNKTSGACLAVAWVIVAVFWIIGGIYICLHNFTGDTCNAFSEYLAVHKATIHTSIDKLVPCMDANVTLLITGVTKAAINNLTAAFDGYVTDLNANSGGTVSIPHVCLPFDSQPPFNATHCASGTINITQLQPYISNLVCSTDDASGCKAQGLLITHTQGTAINTTLTILSELITSVLPDLEDFDHCAYVFNFLQHVLDRFCAPAENYSKAVYIGCFILCPSAIITFITWLVYMYRKNRNLSIADDDDAIYGTQPQALYGAHVARDGGQNIGRGARDKEGVHETDLPRHEGRGKETGT